MNNNKTNIAKIAKAGFEFAKVHNVHYCQNFKSSQWFQRKNKMNR